MQAFAYPDEAVGEQAIGDSSTCASASNACISMAPGVEWGVGRSSDPCTLGPLTLTLSPCGGRGKINPSAR